MIVWGGDSYRIDRRAIPGGSSCQALLIGVAQMATVHAYAKARGYPTYPRSSMAGADVRDLGRRPRADDAGHHHRRESLRLVHGDEVGGIAVLYAAFLSIIVYREMNMTGLYAALLDTGKLAGVTLFCVGTASTFGWLLAYYKMPKPSSPASPPGA